MTNSTVNADIIDDRHRWQRGDLVQGRGKRSWQRGVIVERITMLDEWITLPPSPLYLVRFYSPERYEEHRAENELAVWDGANALTTRRENERDER